MPRRVRVAAERNGADMTFDTETATYEDGLKCSYCGEHDELRWVEHVRQELIARQACHGCGFWLSHAERNEAGDADRYVLTSGYEHYMIGLEDGGMFRGFGGHRFAVYWIDDNRETTFTSNLWSQGVVPEHLRDRFTVNAELASAPKDRT